VPNLENDTEDGANDETEVGANEGDDIFDTFGNDDDSNSDRFAVTAAPVPIQMDPAELEEYLAAYHQAMAQSDDHIGATGIFARSSDSLSVIWKAQSIWEACSHAEDGACDPYGLFDPQVIAEQAEARLAAQARAELELYMGIWRQATAQPDDHIGATGIFARSSDSLSVIWKKQSLQEAFLDGCDGPYDPMGISATDTSHWTKKVLQGEFLAGSDAPLDPYGLFEDDERVVGEPCFLRLLAGFFCPP